MRYSVRVRFPLPAPQKSLDTQGFFLFYLCTSKKNDAKMMQGVKNKSTPLSVLFSLFALKIALKNAPPN